MRRASVLPLLAVAAGLAATAPAIAQGYGYPNDPVLQAGRGRANYGGGLIEMLMTGRDPTPYGRGGAVYNRPAGYAYGAAVRAPSRYEPDPFAEARRPQAAPQAGRQVAALGQPAEPRAGIPYVIEPRFRKQEVAYDGPHRPGTIIVDTPNRFLFLVQPGGRALRYGIGVGRPGFSWAGTKTVTRKAEWPSWTPPAEMLKRRPDLPRFMAGGPENPLGARALYLGSTLYRIHGTNEPNTIGREVSSGCIRMTNEDVVDLYGKVGVGTKVIVI
ncbi:L,D-transpeptidase [Bosea minatitlanensis]|uniref:L,D-transpeptidase n=1 Tax=Bosea minatitlanensis TaxID=128782 RepID=A0ABW0F159_9HYPH|nr:L,D-transpeptidase [Bosea minatitlanensis]MCT4492934.1 L,D-transpeptidase [Bosea minatitlanensis]